MRKKHFDVFYWSTNRRGFTLVELLVVLSLIAILATIAVPLYLGQRTRAMQKEAMTHLEALRLLQEQYYAEKAEYAASLGTCDKNHPENVDAIRTGTDGLPAFKPGRGEDLIFSYCIIKDKAIDPDNPMSTLIDNSPCFTAQAIGNSGYQIEGQVFRVDCNNVKTY